MTNEPKPESKPLMIRGDRLLLALDVLTYVVRFCRYDCPKVAQRAMGLHDSAAINPRRCSRDKVLTVLHARCSFVPKPCPRGPHHDTYCIHCDVPINFTDGTPGRLRSFLNDQRDAGLLNEQRFMIAEWVIGHVAYDGGLDMDVTRQLLCHIAPGDLTEADLTEGA